MRSALAFAILFATTACGHVRIQDPALIQPAIQIGDASTALIQTPRTASQQDVSAAVQDIETALVDLVLAHDDWSERHGPSRAPNSVPLPVDTGPLTWDGSRLLGSILTDKGAVESSLRFQDRRTEFASSGGDAVCVAYEQSGTPMHVECHPFLDQTLVVSHQAHCGSQVDIAADYGLVFDGDRCAAGGQVDLSYRVTPPSGTPREGVVSATFHGCGRIQIFTRE